jgi:hypothetical protein
MGKTLADQPFMLTDFSFNPYKFNKAVLNKFEPKNVHVRSAISPTQNSLHQLSNLYQFLSI